MRLAAAFCLLPGLALSQIDRPALGLPCMEVLDGIQSRGDYAATLVARGVEGVADNSFGVGVLAGIGLGHAIARGADPADAKSIGFTMGQTCAENPSLTYRELLEAVSPPP